MVESIIFNGLNSLDFQDIRSNVTRIPEVIKRIREAQDLWDANQTTYFDLLNFICSDNKTFYSNIHLKSLASSVVQVGLYDRYLRYQKSPKFLIGNSNGYTALKVAAGEMSFEEMVVKSATCLNSDLQVHEAINVNPVNEPVLSGISLTEYSAYRWSRVEEKYVLQSEPKMDIFSIIYSLVEDERLQKIVNVGPGNSLITRNNDDLILEQVQILESIDLDPMLSWFWSSMKECLSA